MRIAAIHMAPFLLLALLLPGRAAAQLAQLDLVGSWHVLIHYTDANTSKPDQARWSDRVWVFERKGSRLSWIEYPIVVFNDESRRFERRQASLARVLGAWQPNEAQLANIRGGLKINNRGQKKKTLRGSDAGGWSSTARARPGSASIITFEENWSIQGLPDLPLFEQLDVMGSGLSETMEGATRWETTKVEEGGAVLRGRFDRDGTRKGTFIMRRSGAVGQLEKRSQKEIQQAAFRRGTASQEIEKVDRESLATQMDASVPSGGEHDDIVIYGLPFDSDVPRMLYIGQQGSVAISRTGGGVSSVKTVRSRKGMEQTVVFAMPKGSTIVAAREGRVIEASHRGRVAILHPDGSVARYWPFQDQPDVKVGDEVERSTVLGRTGTGRGGGKPQMVFGVWVVEDDGKYRSIKVRLDDGSAEGSYLSQGSYYGGKQTR